MNWIDAGISLLGQCFAFSPPDRGYRVKHAMGRQTHECRTASQRVRANRRKAARRK